MLAGGLLLSSCTLGPNFDAPKVATPPGWSHAGDPALGPHPETTAAIEPRWWRILNDPLLDQLITRVASENLGVRAASERVEASRAQLGVTEAENLPQLNGNASYNRDRLSENGVISLLSPPGTVAGVGSQIPVPPSTIPSFDLYQYGLDASWEIDLWGRARRKAEAAGAALAATEEARREVVVSVMAETALDYLELRGTQASLATTERDLEAARQIARVARERLRSGLGNEIDLIHADAQVSAVEAVLPGLRRRQSALINAVALLLAEPPGALDAVLRPAQPIPPAPPQVPIGIPTGLLERRPDVRQAEAALHKAVAEIGVAEADFYPRLMLSGSGAIQALDASDLSNWAARTYGIGPTLTLPIFDGGRLKATLELRKASEREAALQYKTVVLKAFHEVDSAITAYRAEQLRRAALVDEQANDRKALDLAVDRYKNGLGDFLTVLNDERSIFAAELRTTESTEAADLDMVRLYKALGGGWETIFPQPAAPPSPPAS